MVSTEEAGGVKKKFFIGSFMPRVPSYLLQKKDVSGKDSSAESVLQQEPVGDGDELGELPDFHGDRKSHDGVLPPPSAASVAAAALRRRGMSIEQTATSLYRKMSIRQSSAPEVSGETGGAEKSSGPAPSSTVFSPRSDPSLKARRGQCVATIFGTGTVVDVRLDDGFYVVQLVPSSIAYLRDDSIIREIKAIVGERVKTRWGLATVEHYYVEDDMYSIALDWRWDDEHVWRMKATTKKFEKINPRGSIMQNTKNKLFEGYSTLRGSTSVGYANVVAKLNTTVVSKSKSDPAEDLGKALTMFGICTVNEIRDDKVVVVSTPCGAIGYLNEDSVRLLQRRTNFADGERVKTPYGLGQIVCYRDEDETYEVKLDSSLTTTTQAPMLYIHDGYAETLLSYASASSGASNKRLSSILNMTRSSVFTASASVKASATGGFTTLSSVRQRVSSMATIKMAPKPKFQKGERVVTKFGSGFVTDVRLQDKIYEINLRRLKFIGYFHESSVEAFPYERVTHLVVDGKTIPAPDIPRNTSDFKRRAVINEAIKAAREGKMFATGNNAAQASEQPVDSSPVEMAAAPEPLSAPVSEPTAVAASEPIPVPTTSG